MITHNIKRLVIVIFALLLIMVTNSFGHYCTQENFDTGVHVYNQSLQAHQKALDVLTPIIRRYNKEVFTHRRFTFEQMTESLSASNDNLELSVQNHVERLAGIMVEADKATKKFVNAKKRTPTAIGIWEKIADSCAAIDEPTNAQYARENVKFSRELLSLIDDNFLKHREIMEIYQKEIDFLDQVLKNNRVDKASNTETSPKTQSS